MTPTQAEIDEAILDHLRGPFCQWGGMRPDILQLQQRMLGIEMRMTSIEKRLCAAATKIEEINPCPKSKVQPA